MTLVFNQGAVVVKHRREEAGTKILGPQQGGLIL